MTATTTAESRPFGATGEASVITVALVEDDAGLRRTMERLLNFSPGFRCACSCGSGEEALKQIPRNPPDAVLMDIHLPNRSGIECAALLRQQLPKLQIIMLTVYDDSATLFKALRAGACGYLLKRARPNEILEAIHEAQRGGAPMSSEIARRVVESFRAKGPARDESVSLTAREEETLVLLTKGFSNKEIADQLSLGVETVRSHLKHIYEKMHVRSRAEAVARYMSAGRVETR